MIGLSPFAHLLAEIAAKKAARAAMAAPKPASPRQFQDGPRRGDRAAKASSKCGAKSWAGARGSKSKDASLGNFLHLNHATTKEPNPVQTVDHQALAAAILALPEAKKHPAAAVRLAAAGVTVKAARDVLSTIPVAQAARVNSREHPLVQTLMAARGAIDGQTHQAVKRGPELTKHDRWNARMAGIERAESIRTRGMP